MKFLLYISLLTALPVVMATPAAAQETLVPDREEACDPATASSLPLNDSSSEAAACARRTYWLPAADTVSLHQDHYDRVEVVSWEEPSLEVETIVVTRRSTRDSARADLPRVKLQQVNGVFQSIGPDGDAPGWWSVKYRLRVPAQTALAITTDSGRIDVQGVVGAHEIRSDDGRIDVTLPADAGVRLLAETDYGTIDVGFPVTTQGAISE
ncbi:MAG: hypothetical protein GVY35_10900, partial [Bacteroidetes bacterium]|nr:hypothetical protein [Bacteroidota bacterium]